VAASAPAVGLKEGFPTCWPALWRALGRYDEAFVGYGGNKEEFVRRLIAVSRSRRLQMRVLTSVLALHQPHPPDPGRRQEGAQRIRNAHRFRTRLREIQRRAPWWRQAYSAATAALSEISAEFVVDEPAASSG
jgi:hypothetical protein